MDNGNRFSDFFHRPGRCARQSVGPSARPPSGDGSYASNRSVLICAAMLCFLAGCLPSTRIVKNPGPCDDGLRYYRPKPYLLVQPMLNKAGEPVEGFVHLEQVTLPDFSEEYSIHIRSGLGTNETEVELADGWRLESLNVSIDSNFDENLRAIADFAEAIPTLTAAGDDDQSRMAMPASNVPLGYYESVVSAGCDGKKRLYGFRYVGFMPFAACPVHTSGSEVRSCYDDQIYGLVFDGQQMSFAPLHEIAIGGHSKPSGESEPVQPEMLPPQPAASMLDEE